MEKKAGGVEAAIHAPAASSCGWHSVCGRPGGIFLVPEPELAVPADLRDNRLHQRLVTRSAPERLTRWRDTRG